MNLGTIKDKTVKRSKRPLLMGLGALGLACAVVAVTVLLSGTGQAAKTERQASATSVPAQRTPQVTIGPRATATSAPTKGPAAEADTSVSGEAVVEAPMLSPVTSGTVLKAFTEDKLVYSATLKHWSTHPALDLSAQEGTEVLSVLDGTVDRVDEDPLLGLTVVLSHEDGSQTVYASLGTVAEGLASGDRVKRGQVVGTVGTSAASEKADGPHVHFQMMRDGKAVAPPLGESASSK